ncbi:IMPACT family member in pol 5'region [Pseudomonas sp. 8AS]|uniref:IMPACT family protein n=1 Tax=Pseudomonas sp. 8AS TaxID=2653163 RepID=UPI0012EFC0AC|nr:YigZ family protein [Pseudomonas sp. 8AS]VXB34384.1 IMPACT family member in pol 5'region [Pseudomonas sp. 8AS]
MPFSLLGPCEYREDIRKSRFLALAAPVASAEEALAFIQQHSDLGASHNCWAFKCGQQYRFSDDGEPGGTAGRPILAAIDNQDCDQVVVLVIRWYGGIQLGTGGLARAYGGSAAKCLQGGQRIALLARTQARCHVPFAELARVKARLGEWQALIEEETFDADGARLQLALPAEQLEQATRQLADISSGRIRLERLP